MIAVDVTEEGYSRCYVCHKSRCEDETEVFDIRIGRSENDVNVQRLCLECVYELKMKLATIR